MSVKKVKKSTIQLVKGMKDVLPDEQQYWQWLRDKADLFAKNYGYNRLDTPVLEFTALFKRSVGEDTDIVSKEMYSLVTEGGDKLSLRPENTAGVARAYIEHGMVNQPQPVKLYYIGPQYRHEKPQAGRYRQLWQFGFECLGDVDPVIDVQLVVMSYQFLKELGLDVIVQINSVGDNNCRPQYIKALKNYYQGHKKDMCPDCQNRMNKNVLRVLDCKNKKCQEISEQAPQILDFLCDDCKNHFMGVVDYLDEMDINYNLNHKIVRGLDYYTKTVWEIVENSEEGKLSSLCGGGRYDGLIETLGGRPTPAAGFAIGMERVLLKLQEKKILPPVAKPLEVFVAQLGLEARKKSMSLFEDLRQDGFQVAEAMSKKGLKDQLELANKKGVKYVVILGQKEISDGTVLIRDMESGVQEVVDFRKIKTELRKRLESESVRLIKVKKKII
ncbi:MAG: histidyl-tRNA synthetase [Patescibacteria group bacterium]|nr:histidyl-tRNA synthetase [Patescibacteria group bacterium]